MEIAKGANALLESSAVEVVVTGDVDLTALVLSADGRVSRDADMVFFNHLRTDGVVLSGRTLRIDLRALRAGAAKVVIAASPERDGEDFSEVGDVRVMVRSGGDFELVTGRLGVETVVVLGEVYAYQGSWKVRTVGQGYANGLAGLATDFGVQVEDPSSPPPVIMLPDTPPAPELNLPARPAPEVNVPSSLRSSPGMLDAAPGLVAPPGGNPSSGPRASAAVSGGFSSGAPAYFSGPPGKAPVTAPALDLSKGRVSLAKGQTVVLEKDGVALTGTVSMGLGWDADGSGRVDLDASVIAFDAVGRDLKKVWFMRKSAYRGALKHSGDNLTGAGEGDDETIKVDLGALPDEVVALVFTVNSYSGQDFTQVRRAFCRLVGADGTELVRFDLSRGERAKGVLMAAMTRSVHGWSMTGLGEFHDGRTVKAMVGPARQAVLRG